MYLFKSVARLVNRLEGTEKEKAAKAAVSAAKKGKDDQIAYWIHMLTYMKSDLAVDALIGLAGPRNPPGTRMVAIEAVGRQNSEKGIAFLIEQLKLEEWQFRASAIKGLSYYRDPRVIEALIEGGRTEKGALQRKYFAALARIVQESVPGTIEAWQSYWNDNKEDLIERWARFPKGEPVETELADIPIDTSLGSTSFYGINTNSKHLIFVVDVSGSMGDESQKNEQGRATNRRGAPGAQEGHPVAVCEGRRRARRWLVQHRDLRHGAVHLQARQDDRRHDQEQGEGRRMDR